MIDNILMLIGAQIDCVILNEIKNLISMKKDIVSLTFYYDQIKQIEQQYSYKRTCQATRSISKKT